MQIKSGSEWVDDKSGLDVVVESIIAAALEETKVVYKLFDNTGNYLGYNSCTYEAFLVSKTPKAYIYEYRYSKGYEHGVQHMKMQNSMDKYLEVSDKLSLTEDEVDNIIDEAFEEGYVEGYNQHEYEMHQVMSERELDLKAQAYDEGYDQAIDDLIEAGVIGEGEYSDDDYSDEDCSEECYSEYEFGDVEDDEEDGEEEYCFYKELDRILNNPFVVDNKSDGVERKHSHYFKDVRHLDYLDIYELNKLFPIDDDTDCILHARKKLLVCGGRGGSKDMITDITDARDTLNRYLQIEGIE